MYRKKSLFTRKRYLTMAELVIAIALTAILFSTVLLWMRQQSVMRQKTRSLQNYMQAHMQVEMLLGELFGRAAPIDYSMQIKDPNHLRFISRGLPSAELAFRGLIEVELLYDPMQQTLQVRQRPLNDERSAEAQPQEKVETLLEGVHSLHWQLLDAEMEHFLPKSKEERNSGNQHGEGKAQEQKTPEQKTPEYKSPVSLQEDTWQEKHLPMMIRLEVLTEKGDRDYVFTIDSQPLAIDVSTTQEEEL